MLTISRTLLCSILVLVLLQCKKEEHVQEPEKPVIPASKPKEITVVQGNNQVGGYNLLLSDTIIIKIVPQDKSDIEKYSYTYSFSDNQNGSIIGSFQQEENDALYVKVLWKLGLKPLKQEIKIYLHANCKPPFTPNDCVRLDSATISATVREPWKQVYSNSGTFQDLYFTDQNNALVVGDYSTGIVRTSDGGRSWTNTPAFRGDLYKLSFANKDTGFVMVSNNYGYITNDGGKTFQYENWTPPTIGHLSSTDFYMVNRKVIYSVGTHGAIAKTVDGGLSWEKYEGFSFINRLNSITCVDESNCYACGSIAKIVKTIDGGKSWQEQEILINNNLTTLTFLNTQLGFAGGQYGILIRTTNGGLSWQVIKTGIRGNIIAIKFFDQNNGVIVSNSGGVSTTSDGGLTWIKLCADNYGVFDLKKVVVKNNKEIYAIQGNSINRYDLAQ